MEQLSIDKKKTALVVIDLQKGILAFPAAPNASKDVVTNCAKIIKSFRSNHMPVFLVHVNSNEYTSLNPKADFSMNPGTLPKDWAEFVPELGKDKDDIIITKHQWGAFHDTGLDMQLRRRKIDTIVLCGIATSYGVESTARDAYELGYHQVFPEDAMTSLNAEEHKSTINNIFPKMGLVRKTTDVLAALK